MAIYISLKMRFFLRNPYKNQKCPHFNPLVSCKSYRFGKVITPFLKVETLRVTKNHVSLYPKKWAENSKFWVPAHGLDCLFSSTLRNSWITFSFSLILKLFYSVANVSEGLGGLKYLHKVKINNTSFASSCLSL